MVKLGEFAEKSNADQEYQAFIAKAGANPPFEIVKWGQASDLTLP